ncbi:hypothetical protein IX51_08955 [uncultured archaeon]|nr:hypothetical protein IX51_08955 [uncultured archaeon]
MGSVLLLLFWKASSKRVLDYIVPIWEVTGTFGAFWVVITDFAFPNILIPASKLYAVALMLFLILFVARNSTIVFGEYIIKKRWLDHKKLYQMYSLSTIALGIIALTIFSSIISGSGINIEAGYFSVPQWIGSAGSIPFILGALLIGVGLAPVFYGLHPFRKITLPVTAAGVALSSISFYFSSPGLVTPLIAVPIVLTILVPVLFMYQKTAALVSNKLVFSIVATAILFSMSFLVYPTAFGRTLNVDDFTTSGPMSGAFLIITAVGGIMLAVMVYFYLVAVKRSQLAREPAA